MIDHKQTDLDYLLARDLVLFKDKDKHTGFVGVRIWRGNEFKLLDKETWKNWESIGHVALKTYGENSEYISFFPNDCTNNNKCHSHKDHLHSQEQDEIYGAPKEFLVKVNNIKNINEEINKLATAIEQGKLIWSRMNILIRPGNSSQCSHLVHKLLTLGGINLNLLTKSKLTLRFLVYYFIKRNWLLFISLFLVIKLIKNFDSSLSWSLTYKENLFAKGNFLAPEDAIAASNFLIRLFLSIHKFLIRHTNQFFIQSIKGGRVRGFLYAISTTSLLLLPLIYLTLYLKNYLILTPEDIYFIAKELDLLKNYNQNVFNKGPIYSIPSLIYKKIAITHQIGLASVINTSPLRTRSSRILNQLGGHAALIVESTKECISGLLKDHLNLIQRELKKINQIRQPISKKRNELAKQLQMQKSLSYIYLVTHAVTDWFRERLSDQKIESPKNISMMIERLDTQLQELDYRISAIQSKEKKITTKLENLNKIHSGARYLGIFDIEAKPEHKLIPLSPAHINQINNNKGYIVSIKIQQFIIDELNGVFEILPHCISQINACAWLDWFKTKLLGPARKDKNRVYSLGPHAVKQLITNIELESTKVSKLMQEQKYIQLPKWQLLGKYSLFPIKDWDGLNCAEWCNQHLYQVGALSKEKATAKSIPPKGIQEALIKGFENIFT